MVVPCFSHSTPFTELAAGSRWENMSSSTADPSWGYTSPMEPIPEEEDHESVGNASHTSKIYSTTTDGDNTRKFEQKHRTREIYTSEQVDTLVSTVPKSEVPLAWDEFAEEKIVADPEMASTYITGNVGGPASARGTTYSYTYETMVDDPEVLALEQGYTMPALTEADSDGIERHSTQMQKVTRVTKITTTRSVRQVPVDPNDIFFDSLGNPVIKEYSGVISPNKSPSGDSYNENKTYITECEEYNIPSSSTTVDLEKSSIPPGAPGVPQVIDFNSQEVTLVWARPPSDANTGGLLGYRVEFRHGDEPWEIAHDDLLLQTECRITNLDPLSDYQFRVLAANTAGFGLPSNSTPPIQLQSRFDAVSKPNEYNVPVNVQIVGIEGDRCTIQWESPLLPGPSPVAGYIIEYRAAGTSNWLMSTDSLITGYRHDVTNLRPNGEYEFCVIARFEDGTMSQPSASTGFVKIKPTVPSRSQHLFNPDLFPPGPPQVVEFDSTWVFLQWVPSPTSDLKNVSYVVEMHEIGDPTWYTATQTPIVTNELIIENLHPDSNYEFRVSTVGPDNSQSEPSETSDVVQLRPMARVGVKGKSVPERPSAPEYFEFDGGTSVTLCWEPAKSVLPVEGYEVEFRDFQQNAVDWFKVTDKLVYSCKTTVGYLIPNHQYQFRIIAKNAYGYSQASDASPPITIGKASQKTMSPPPTMADVKYIEAQRFGSISLLQDEIIRESPPLPDRDDSPPPMCRQLNSSNLHWRDPTLKEVIDYLKNNDPEIQRNASGYLQHLTYNDNSTKEDTRNYGGIPLLVKLLSSSQADVQRNAGGCLKNLAFGRENEENKKVIAECKGVNALANTIQASNDPYVREEATGALWNISSCDDLKEHVLNNVTDVIVESVVVPYSGILIDEKQSTAFDNKTTSNVFRNGTGVLRNISAANNQARHVLRKAPRLVDSLIHYLDRAIAKNQVDSRGVENVVCVLRNLSYRVEEVVNPKYHPRNNINRKKTERSRSAPSDNKKEKKSGSFFKKNKKGAVSIDGQYGPTLLWNANTIRMYLKLLQDSSNSDTLEASAAAIQNVAACDFEGAQNVRMIVRQEQGLAVLTELLKVQDEKVLTAVATALRNLVLDPANCEIVGKTALPMLIDKLPRPDDATRDPRVNDATLSAILGILFDIIRSNAQFTRNFHELGGTARLRKLARSMPLYSAKVCKYATQVLYMMWQHKELHDGFRRSGLKEADFYSGSSTARSRDTATLARPISSQGAERPLRHQSDNLDDSGESAATFPHHSAQSVSPNSDQTSPSPRFQNNVSQQMYGEPLYASVNKKHIRRRGSIGGDSWV